VTPKSKKNSWAPDSGTICHLKKTQKYQKKMKAVTHALSFEKMTGTGTN
jgi:hypothetical protein